LVKLKKKKYVVTGASVYSYEINFIFPANETEHIFNISCEYYPIGTLLDNKKYKDATITIDLCHEALNVRKVYYINNLYYISGLKRIINKYPNFAVVHIWQANHNYKSTNSFLDLLGSVGHGAISICFEDKIEFVSLFPGERIINEDSPAINENYGSTIYLEEREPDINIILNSLDCLKMMKFIKDAFAQEIIYSFKASFDDKAKNVPEKYNCVTFILQILKVGGLLCLNPSVGGPKNEEYRNKYKVNTIFRLPFIDNSTITPDLLLRLISSCKEEEENAFPELMNKEEECLEYCIKILKEQKTRF